MIEDALSQIEDIYIATAKPPITHDWCRLCKSANSEAGESIEHWLTCPIAILYALQNREQHCSGCGGWESYGAFDEKGDCPGI